MSFVTRDGQAQTDAFGVRNSSRGGMRAGRRQREEDGMKPKARYANLCTAISESGFEIVSSCRLIAVSLLIFILLTPSYGQSPIFQFQWEGFLPFSTTSPHYPQGYYTAGSLVQIKPGVFVGTAQGGGSGPNYTLCTATGLSFNFSGCGTLYQIDTTTSPSPTITLLYTFAGGTTDGAQPTGSLAFDGTYIYGTTQGYGAVCEEFGAEPPSCGTIYRFDPKARALTVLYAMNPSIMTDGRTPTVGVTLGSNGHLYGTTQASGVPPYFESTIFEYVSPSTVPPGTAPVFHAVDLPSYGLYPQLPIDYGDGNLYFTTQADAESIVEFNTTTTLFAECAVAEVGGTDVGPIGRLAVGTDGALYGVGKFSSTGDGQIFRVDLSGGCTGSSPVIAVHTFAGGAGADPGGPLAGILGASDGAMYGTGTAEGVDPSGSPVVGEIYSAATSVSNPSGIKTIAVYPGATASGYGVGDVVTVTQSGGSGGTALVTSTGTAGSVTSVALVSPGTGYSIANALATTGGSGTGLKLDVTAVVAEQPLYSTEVSSPPYIDPGAELLEGSDGWIYGTGLDSPQATSAAIFRFLPPPINTQQIGTANVYDAGGPIAVDPQPQAGQAHPGPRIYVTGASDSNLSKFYGGEGPGGFFVARYFSDGTLDTSFGGGFIQFGPATVSRSTPDYVSAVLVDSMGNVVLAGSTVGSVYNCTNNQGGSDIWVASFSPLGKFQWCRMFGSTQDDYAGALTVDSKGNLYVAGSTTGSLPGYTLFGSEDGFIAEIAKGSHALTLYEFSQNAQDETFGNGIAVCGGNLYLAVNAGPNGTNGGPGQSGWLNEYNAQTFKSGPRASLQLATNYTTGPVTNDLSCNVYAGASFFTTSGGISKSYIALQKYDKLLNKKWETDGPVRTAEGSQILYPDYLTSLVLDAVGNVYAGGSTNSSIFNRPLPTNCDLLPPVITCAGWFAAFNAGNGALLPHSAQEFGNAGTGLAGMALDLYGWVHVSGDTVAPLISGSEFDNSVDAFEMDFGPTAFFPVRAVPTVTTFTAVPNPAPHGSPITLTATIANRAAPPSLGSVTFVADLASGGYVVLNPTPAKVNAAGTATFTTSLLPVGVHNVSAVYTGTSLLSPATSTILVTVE